MTASTRRRANVATRNQQHFKIVSYLRIQRYCHYSIFSDCLLSRDVSLARRLRKERHQPITDARASAVQQDTLVRCTDTKDSASVLWLQALKIPQHHHAPLSRRQAVEQIGNVRHELTASDDPLGIKLLPGHGWLCPTSVRPEPVRVDGCRGITLDLREIENSALSFRFCRCLVNKDGENPIFQR